MKLLIIVLLAVVATAASERCKPNSSYKYYCNRCKCSPTGYPTYCTRMYCSPNIWNKDGTRKVRAAEPYEEDEPEQVCEPGTSFKDYCNSCKCSDDGKFKFCTMMACDLSVWNKDGSRKSELKYEIIEEVNSEESEQVCEPRTTFNDYCNTCKCSHDGKSKVCTMMACDPSVWNKDGTLKPQISEESKSRKTDLMCEPHSIFNDYCNTCTCFDDGTDAFCTLMACDPKVWNKDGTLKSGISEE